MVSSKGFYTSARKKAEHLGIRCLDLEQAISLDWLLAPGFTIVHRILKYAHWTVFPERQIFAPFEEYRIVNEEKQEINSQILQSNLLQQTGGVANPGYFPPTRERFVFSGTGLFLEHKATQERIPLHQLIADAEYEVKTDVTGFELFKYLDKSSGHHITDTAVAPVEVGELSGKVMIVYTQDKGGRVLFVPEKRENT